MDPVTGLVIGGAIGGLGSFMGGREASKGAKDAARAQLQSAQIAADLQREMFDRQMGYYNPFFYSGIQALPTLQQMALGTAPVTQFRDPASYVPNQTAAPAPQTTSPLRQNVSNALSGAATQTPAPVMYTTQGAQDPMQNLKDFFAVDAQYGTEVASGLRNPITAPGYDSYASGAMNAMGGPSAAPGPQQAGAPTQEPTYITAQPSATAGRFASLRDNALSRLADPNAFLDFESDPLYQAMSREMMRNADRSAAASGLRSSSANENIIARNLVPLLSESYNRRYGQTMDLLNAGNMLDTQQYGRVLDLAKIGAGAAQSAGAGSQALGQSLASTQIGAGNAMANAAMQQGQIQGGMMQSLGMLPLNALNAYQNYQTANQSRYPTNPFMSSGNPLGLTPGQGL